MADSTTKDKEISTQDIGEEYLVLVESKVPHKDIGDLLYRFVNNYAEKDESDRVIRVRGKSKVKRNVRRLEDGQK